MGVARGGHRLHRHQPRRDGGRSDARARGGRPLTGYILPSLAHGRVALVQDSGNLGELVVGKGNALSILPAALWIVAGSWWILRRSA